MEVADVLESVSLLMEVYVMSSQRISNILEFDINQLPFCLGLNPFCLYTPSIQWDSLTLFFLC